MAWLTLGEALEAALVSRLNEVGDEVAGTRLDAAMSKKRPSRSPAKFQGEVSQEAIVGTHQRETPLIASHAHMGKALPMGRKRCTAPSSPSPVVASPKPAVRRFLLIEGGLGDRPERREERASGRSIAQAAGGGRTATSNLRIVEGGRHAAALIELI